MNPPGGPIVEPIGSDDIGIVEWVLVIAAGWRNPESAGERSDLAQHPELKRYHEGWGRRGDFGVTARIGGAVVGAAVARLYTDRDHGFGFVDPATPEIGLAVDQRHRRSGIGRALMLALAEEARVRGFARLSLSVEDDNPAAQLYLSLGFRTVDAIDGASTMLLDL